MDIVTSKLSSPSTTLSFITCNWVQIVLSPGLATRVRCTDKKSSPAVAVDPLDTTLILKESAKSLSKLMQDMIIPTDSSTVVPVSKATPNSSSSMINTKALSAVGSMTTLGSLVSTNSIVKLSVTTGLRAVLSFTTGKLTHVILSLRLITRVRSMDPNSL